MKHTGRHSIWFTTSKRSQKNRTAGEKLQERMKKTGGRGELSGNITEVEGRMFPFLYIRKHYASVSECFCSFRYWQHRMRAKEILS